MDTPGPRDEAAFDRMRDFAIAAAKSERALAKEWRDALHDVALELEKIAYESDDLDAIAGAETAMSALSGVWLDDDEKDQLYLGALPPEGP